jgi:multiple sugar transport system ATP-binding protein
MSSISLKDVTKRYGDGYEAVKHMDLDIEDGEFMILVGPSGCGKSTALRMVAGLEDISEGDLNIGGERVNDKAPKDRDIAMVFQNYALYPHMTVRENMGFALKLAKVPDEEIRRKVEDAAKTLDLTEHLDRKPSNLSGGQRQRVAMGRAIVREPSVFLMDEPLSNLDAKLRVQMRTEVARIQQRLGVTTIYVTHDQTEAKTLGDRVAVMRAGVLQQVASPRELYDDPVNLFVAGFIGSPAMNFFPATVEGDRLKLPMGEVALPDHLREALSHGAPKDLIAGLRPGDMEDAHVVPEDHQSRGHVFEADIELVESMGSESYAYFTLEGGAARADELAELAADAGLSDLASGGDDARVTARLSAESDIKDGQRAKPWMDVTKLHLFDAHDGAAVGHRGSGRANGSARSEGDGDGVTQPGSADPAA